MEQELTCECGNDTEFTYGEFEFDVWGNPYRVATCDNCGKQYAIQYQETSVAPLEEIQV